MEWKMAFGMTPLGSTPQFQPIRGQRQTTSAILKFSVPQKPRALLPMSTNRGFMVMTLNFLSNLKLFESVAH
jgi:hypothetical protein